MSEKFGNCPFDVYVKDDVKRSYTAALFKKPRHMRCDRDECMMWDDGCLVRAALKAICGRDAE